MLKKGLILIFLSGSLLCVPLPASAHRVNVFAYVQGETCYVQGYFSRTRRAQNAKVEVFDRQGQKLLEGKTDSEGNFSFKIPKRTDLKVVLTAGMGHRGEFMVRAEEMEDGAGPSEAGTPSNLEKEHEVTFREIIAGLGCILGIFGIAMWIAGRKKHR